jgi:hypothetical protein
MTIHKKREAVHISTVNKSRLFKKTGVIEAGVCQNISLVFLMFCCMHGLYYAGYGNTRCY